MMRGPIVCQLCMGRYRETNILEDEFTPRCCWGEMGGGGGGGLHCWYTTLVKYSRYAWGFLSKYQLKPPFKYPGSADMSFS